MACNAACIRAEERNKLSYPDDGCNRLLRMVGTYLPTYHPSSPCNLVRNRFTNIFWWGGVIGLNFFSLFQVSGDTRLLLLC